MYNYIHSLLNILYEKRKYYDSNSQDFWYTKIDNSLIIVDISKFDSYIPFLISSLGLTSEDDINKIKELKTINNNEWLNYTFLIEYDNECIYTESFIKLFVLAGSGKFYIYFFRLRAEHNSASLRTWKSSNLYSLLEHKINEEAINKLEKHHS